jgi:ACS family D-galactonate transporter-like MFS transporter
MSNKMIFALLLGFEVGLCLMNIPPALDELMVLYNASYTRISILMGALYWSHAFMQIPGGIITDRLGVGRALAMSLACVCAGNLIPAVYPSLELAIAGRVITGVGTGLSFVSGMKFIAVYAPPGYVGSFQSFMGGSFSVGGILVYLLLPYLISFGWQWTYLLPGLFGLALVPMLIGLRLQSSSTLPPAPLPFHRIVRIKAGWILGFYHALSYGSIIALGNWVPSLLAEAWGNSTATQLAWGGALVMLISGLGRLAGGVILLRMSPLLIAHGSILILAALYLPLSFISMPMAVLIMTLAATWFASINFGALFNLVSRATSSDSLGSLLGFMNLLANLGAILFIMMLGWVKDTMGSFSWGFGILAIMGLGAFLLGQAFLQRGMEKRPSPAG